MGEIADAYIWAEINGVDLDNNPEGWSEYYHEKECEEYEEEIAELKKEIRATLKKIRGVRKKC